MPIQRKQQILAKTETSEGVSSNPGASDAVQVFDPTIADTVEVQDRVPAGPTLSRDFAPIGRQTREELANFGDEGRQIGGFFDERIGPRLARDVVGIIRRSRRQHDDRNPFGCRIAAQRSQQSKPVEVGHDAVSDDEIGQRPMHLGERIAAVERGEDFVLLGF